MKKNYESWEIDSKKFYQLNSEREKIQFLLKYVILAPSSHNSQPWKFKITNNQIVIYLNEDRLLLESDRNNRQAYLSIGCAIKNLEIAADYFGYKSEIRYTFLGKEVAIVSLVHKSDVLKSKYNDLIYSIPTRTTNRGKYSTEPLEKDFINEIETFSISEQIKIDLISDKITKEKLADIAVDAMTQAMDNLSFRKELSQYIKNNLTNSSIGMPAFGLNIPTPLSFFIPKLIKYFNVEKLSKRQDLDLFKKHTPSFILISTKEDNPLMWIKVGEIYENIALLAEKNGVSTSAWQAPVEIDKFSRDIMGLIRTDYYPQFFCRIGRAYKKTSHSPRISVDEVMEI